MKADATVVLLSYADVCFMMAETAIKFPGVVSGTAQSYYEAGIQASMEQYGVAKSAVTAYMKRDGIKWNTNGSGLWEYRHFFKADIPGEGGDDAHLTQIYRQWYFADFFYGHQGWTLDRRTRCMNYPPYFYNNATPVGGNGICDWYSERLAYPQNEMYHNREGYEEAVAMLVKNSPEPNLNTTNSVEGKAGPYLDLVLGNYEIAPDTAHLTDEMVAVMQQHVDWAIEAGVDFFILPSLQPNTNRLYPRCYAGSEQFADMLRGKNRSWKLRSAGLCRYAGPEAHPLRALRRLLRFARH